MNKELKSAIVRKYGCQWPFAQALGERESTVSAVIRGKKELPDEKKKQWAEILETSPRKIFGGGSNV